MTNQDYMKRALELAKKAMGYTSPNPMVGCVVGAANIMQSATPSQNAAKI